MSDQANKALEVKRKNEKNWMAVEGVVAVGVGMEKGKPAIIVSVKKDPDAIRKQIPSAVDGIPVQIQFTGNMKAL